MEGVTMHQTVPLTPFPWADVFIILALVALNGLFAMSELAIGWLSPKPLAAMRTD
jgi:CBS domain containing-hemolysin-like protein